MRFKPILFLCLLALVMMIASEVTARDLAKKDSVETNGVEESKYYGHCYCPPYCHYGCCGNGYYGKCKCCPYAGEAVESVPESKPQN